MPTVTALRDDRRGRVAVELDGAPWRVLPADVVVRAGLFEGRALDREALRLVRRELRRAEALRTAGLALRSRDLSRRRLAERLARSVPPQAAAESIATLERAGLVDDERVACTRAAALADRGWGDEAIRHRLRAEAFDEAVVGEAVEGLEPERERARRLIERRGPGPRTARYLSGRGFGEDAVEAALGAAFGQDG
ncbi:MAG TPA: RecX family transcriptional regulator [Gaiellaceae bacterium]|nr:RecX family transcriptional regulator [Gaiellaceae bacterium]